MLFTLSSAFGAKAIHPSIYYTRLDTETEGEDLVQKLLLARDKSPDPQFHVRVTCNYDDFAKI